MQTMLSIKIDSELKKKAQEVAQALGVSLNAILKHDIQKLVDERYVTFTDHPTFNKKTQKILDKILAESRANKNIVGPFYTAEEMIKSLRSK